MPLPSGTGPGSELAATAHRVRSLGYRTDLLLAGLDGELRAGDGWVAARVPSSPLFWFGNFVLFDAPPGAGDVAEWEATFDRALDGVPVLTRHFGWDVAPAGTAEETDAGAEDGSGLGTGAPSKEGSAAFTDAGYTRIESVVLRCDAPMRAPRSHPTAEVRPIEGAAEWGRVLEIQRGSLPSQRGSTDFDTFQVQQLARDRRLVAAGHGVWYGAFVDGELLATMGLYVVAGIGRCQAVATAPEARRQGLAAALVHAVVTRGLAEQGAREVVMITTPNGPAERVYRSVGFQSVERIASLARARSG